MEESQHTALHGQDSRECQKSHFLKRFVKFGIGLLVLFGLGLAGYSIYVAVHEPDPQETILLGQTKLAAGSPAGFRILVRNRASGQPIQNANVSLHLRNQNAGTSKLGTFRTDASGSVTDAVNIPEISPGDYELIVDVTSSSGSDNVTKKVQVEHPIRLLLSSDKPLYQPGQTIHLRSLAINGRTQKPFASGAVTFEVSDPKGNKVFKESRSTSAFGIASADFVLATELNEGRYNIRATAGAATSERTVEVKRYVLPKFKVQIATDKTYYLPGQTVSGSVNANYFFGKAVNGATVALTAITYQEKSIPIKELKGRTDSQGQYSFQFVLPDFFVGMPQKNEQAFLDLTAEVRDTAEHAETKTLSLSVARNELELTAIPEAGALIPGLENIVYVLTAYPDGRPSVCRVTAKGKEWQSDEQGVCLVKVTPASADEQFEIQAVDSAGRRARLTISPEKQRPTSPLLLRTDKAAYDAGQSAQITVLSTEKNNTVFLDLIKDGQTVLTKSISMNGNRADHTLALPPTLVGTLKLNAYLITATREDRGCSRMIYVSPASALQISAKLAKAVYRPGEVARLDFQVTDPQGRPAPSALGIAAVDESVFALSENQPGLLQQFLAAEGELLKPRYQIKFFASPERLLRDTQKKQTLAQAYLASLGKPSRGIDLDQMVEGGLIPDRMLKRVRDMQRTPQFDSFRQKPEYAQIMRLLEGGYGDYSLREATGAPKEEATRAYREAYFRHLKNGLFLGFCGLLVFAPIFLFFYHSRSAATMANAAFGTAQSAHYLRIARSSHNLFAALILFSLLLYPLGAVVMERRLIPESGWFLLGCEAVVVVGSVLIQLVRIAKAKANQLAEEMVPLRAFLVAFLIQFIVSRTEFAGMAFGRHPEDWFVLALIGTSVAAPLIIFGGLGFHVRKQLMRKGIPYDTPAFSFTGGLVLIFIMFILAGMLLPALSKAKSKAERVTLMNDLKQLDLAHQLAENDQAQPNSGGTTSPRVRRDFPETLFWMPELITDDQGKASLEIPLADSITTWRTAIDAINGMGKMGSAEAPLPVFQEFFVDLDLPVAMSLGDQVSVPVNCYNYLKEPQDVRLNLAAANWFESSLQNTSVHLGPSEVKSVNFPIKVLRVGNHSLRITAQGSKSADAIEREIRVLPTGQQVENTKNDALKENFVETFTIPAEAIPDSEALVVKLYPTRFSEIVEGLDSIFQAPYGCFEQTSSTTYPNVLVLNYLKRMGKLTPEIEIKARKFINAGYQRLLTFEVPGGGFDWFGHPPAHVGLTAYGVLEFTDMSRIHSVDPALIERTVKWLLSKQNADGSWTQGQGLHDWSANTPVTAYVAWALAESGDRSPNLDKALNYLRSHPKEISSAYQQALAANAFLARDRNDSYGRQLATQLKESAIADNDKSIHWTSKDSSMTYSRGPGMEVETTALATMALLKAGLYPQSVKQGLTWISMHKEPNGTWGSTAATILAMRALLQGSGASLGQDYTSTITLSLNGKTVETFQVNKENSDLLKQIDLTKYLSRGENRLELRQSPAGELPFQMAGRYWLAASQTLAASSSAIEPLQIELQYDRATLAVNDQLKCKVSVRNNTGQLINMAIVDLGIPPGFDVDAAAFETLRQGGKIAKMEMTGNQVILYLRELSEAAPFQFAYSLRAKYPLRVQTPRSAVYEYYQPSNRAESKPSYLEATAKVGY